MSAVWTRDESALLEPFTTAFIDWRVTNAPRARSAVDIPGS